MRHLLPFVFTFAVFAPGTVRAQANMFDHEYWHAYGTRDGQEWGGAGLDTLGFVNDSVQHAIAIAEQSGTASGDISSFVYNRTKLDTVRHFEFPGNSVVRGEINGDEYLDAVAVDPVRKLTTVLFGTAKPDSFVTALTIDASKYPGYPGTHTLVLMDCDGDGLADIVISDINYLDSTGASVGRLCFFKGGSSMKNTPTEIITGHNQVTDRINGALLVGKFRDTVHRYLALARLYGRGANVGLYDTLRIQLFPLGTGFRLIPADSIICAIDTLRYVPIENNLSVFATDITGDGIDDILYTGQDKCSPPNCRINYCVFAYSGGKTMSTLPSHFFHSPDPGASFAYGAKILHVGAITGRGYPSIIITDPGASLNEAGGVYLFNTGSALKDSCVAYATGRFGSGDELGIQAIAGGLHGDDGNKNSIAVGSIADTDVIGYHVLGAGSVTIFSGDSAYGPTVTNVHDRLLIISGLDLAPCYPNPVSSSMDISFAVLDSKLFGRSLTIELFDVLGRKCGEIYRGVADDNRYSIRTDVSRLSPGVYMYRLSCGKNQLSRTMSVVR